MKRRELIAGLATSPAWLRVSRAQQELTVIGYLSGRSADSEAPLVASARRGLAENGFIEGQNVAFEFRFANGQENLLPLLAAELCGTP